MIKSPRIPSGHMASLSMWSHLMENWKWWVCCPERHLLCADLWSGRGGSGSLLDLDPGLRVQVGEAGGEALGHRLEVGDVWISLGLMLYWCGGSGRPCRHILYDDVKRILRLFNLDSWQIRWIIKVDLRKIHLWAPRSAVSGQTRGSWWAERSRCGSGSACSGPAEATSLGPPYDGSSCRSLPLPYCPSTPDRGDDGELVSQCDDRNT